MTLPNVAVDIDQLARELDDLAQFSDADPPCVTRVLFTPPDLKARSYLKGLFAAAGLSVRQDAAGNIFARWPGKNAALPPVATGSHADAIPFSGRYDGTVGVLGGLEAIRALQRSGWCPTRPVELVLFTSEEPTRFGIGCLGSRLLCGTLTPRVAERLKDADGLTFETVRRQAGCAGTLAEVCLPANHYGAFVELHIEQGPLLERERIPIGIVTAIAAPASLRVQIYGKGGHAGAVLMPERQDALCAAAEIILAVENTAKASGSSDAVATTGVCHVHPGAINSIPSEVRLQVDVRDIDLTMRDRLLEHIRHAVEETSHRRGTKSAVELLNADPPVRVSSQVVKAIETACRHLAFSSKQMVSRAYHDALFMAQICPTGMIFIPCKDGISHRPEEYASPASIGCGVEVLALTLAQLSEGLGI